MKKSVTIITALLGVVLISLMIVGCANDTTIASPSDEMFKISESTTMLTESITTDSADGKFLSELNNQMPTDRNYMFSPVSIKMAVAMAANGAQGKTQEELIKALGIDNLQNYNIHASELIAQYKEKPTETTTENLYTSWHPNLPDDVVNIANSLWLNTDRGINFKTEFLTNMHNYYDAEVAKVDGTNAVDKINNWCAEKTNNKIPTIINDSEFTAALVNAVYFKGSWLYPFEEYLTSERDFTNRDGSKTKTDFMQQEGTFSYYKDNDDNDIEMIRMPYTGDLSMYIVLSGDKRFSNIEEYAPKLASQKVRVTIPKFRVEYSTELKDMFRKMGVELAFSPEKANFDGMFSTINSQTFIDKIFHKTYIDVDETGTEAAAVTSVLMETSALPSPEKPKYIDFTADKPFTFIIRDDKTGEVFFLGEYAYASDSPEY